MHRGDRVHAGDKKPYAVNINGIHTVLWGARARRHDRELSLFQNGIGGFTGGGGGIGCVSLAI